MNRRGSTATAMGVAALLVSGCFSSSNNGSAPDAGGFEGGESDAPAGFDSTTDSPVGTDAGGNDADGDAPVLPDATGGDGSGGGGDAAAEGGGPCPHSTCTGVEVKFIGWITAADGGVVPVEIAVDDATPDGGPNGTIFLTTSATDPAIGNRNALVADFVTGPDGGVQYPPLYSNDNNACSVPDFAGRTNAYYLVSMQGLPVSPSWQNACGCGGNCGGACNDAGQGYLCDYENGFYSQSCPNFGFNCVITPGTDRGNPGLADTRVGRDLQGLHLFVHEPVGGHGHQVPVAQHDADEGAARGRRRRLGVSRAGSPRRRQRLRVVLKTRDRQHAASAPSLGQVDDTDGAAVPDTAQIVYDRPARLSPSGRATTRKRG